MTDENELGQMAAAIVALCGVSRRGLLTADQLWAAFDRLTFFTVRPDYSGMELFSPNRWGDAGYKGINTSWIDPTTGRTFELQFHTPESFAMKTATHPLYEAMKVPGISEKKYNALKAKNDALFATLPVPPGVSELKFPVGG